MALRAARKIGDTVRYRNTNGESQNVLVSGLAGLAPTAPTPSTATTGGSLAATTTYGYKLTAIVNGAETRPSTEVTQLTGGTATNTVTLTWTGSPVAGATAYRIYGRTSGGPWGFIAEVTGATTAYTDLGSITPSATILAPTTTDHVGFSGFHDGVARTTIPRATTMKSVNAYFVIY
jgi:hypothetical protein